MVLVDVDKLASKGTVVVLFPSFAVIVSIYVFHELSVVEPNHVTPDGRAMTGVELSDAMVTLQAQPVGQAVPVGGLSAHMKSPP